MTDIEKLKELKEKIEPLKKEAAEIQDTIYKSKLAASRFKYFDYGYCKFWIKITSIGAEECSTIELRESYDVPHIQLSESTENFSWLIGGIDITEEVFNKKREELINKLKL